MVTLFPAGRPLQRVCGSFRGYSRRTAWPALSRRESAGENVEACLFRRRLHGFGRQPESGEGAYRGNAETVGLNNKRVFSTLCTGEKKCSGDNVGHALVSHVCPRIEVRHLLATPMELPVIVVSRNSDKYLNSWIECVDALAVPVTGGETWSITPLVVDNGSSDGTP